MVRLGILHHEYASLDSFGGQVHHSDCILPLAFEGQADTAVVFGEVTKVASPIGTGWNQLRKWLCAVDGLRQAA
jgi:hypothetical protein